VAANNIFFDRSPDCLVQGEVVPNGAILPDIYDCQIGCTCVA